MQNFIKEGWKNISLGDLYDYASGLSKGRQYFGSGNPFLSFKDIFSSFFLPNILTNLVQSTDKEQVACSIKRGDVFLTRTSETADEIGMSSVALKDYPNATFNGFTKRLRPKSDKILPEYAGYYFRSKIFRDIITPMCSIITRASLNNEILDRLYISFPESLDTQQKIASFLINYDNLIENNTRRIQILEQTAQEIYKEWFVNFRFPGHETIKMIDSETDFGEIPEGWNIENLGDRIKILKGKNITRATITPGDIPVVAGGISPAYYHNKPNVNGPVITISASGANAGYIRLYYQDIWASDCSYISKDNSKFIYYYFLLLKDKQINITNLQVGSAQPHVYPKDIISFKVIVPNNDIIADFETKISPIFHELSNLENQNNNLKKTRDLLLPKLISGEIDVSELEII